MAGNETYGINNISTGGNTSGLEFQDLEAEIAEGVGGALIGGTQLSGLLILVGLGYGLYTAETPPDVAATVLVPAVFFLGQQGLLPFGQGLIYGTVLAGAAVLIAGTINYISR
jgi:hypothetical protein